AAGGGPHGAPSSMPSSMPSAPTAAAGREGQAPAAPATAPGPIGLVLGSGLGQLAGSAAGATSVPYAGIPGMPRPTVAGHAGELVAGTIEGVPCLLLHGRAHFYEGHGMAEVTFGIRLLGALGVTTLIVTNAAGGLNPAFRAGDVMLIADHIFLPGLAGFHPLRGPNDERRGPRFPAMSDAYDAALRTLTLDLHRASGPTSLRLHHGVYAMVSGPSYETSAELRLLRLAGADAVGMSTCPEVVVARHQGMRVLGLSLIANAALPDQAQVLTHEEVLATAARSAAALEQLVRGIIRRLGRQGRA
ncbi:MAG TPA: purine-nucleoside phosphorylase, partial [Chloroflexota bacterium]|nr:purine-nucleoside phosphorylase [Chloroflexota bacterium]